MKFRYLHVPFYVGLSILCFGILFRIQHWPGSQILIWAGTATELICNVLILTEIISSAKATVQKKAFWIAQYLPLAILSYVFCPSLVCIVLMLISGNYYFRRGRRNFIGTTAEHLTKQFDSI